MSALIVVQSVWTLGQCVWFRGDVLSVGQERPELMPYLDVGLDACGPCIDLLRPMYWVLCTSTSIRGTRSG